MKFSKLFFLGAISASLIGCNDDGLLQTDNQTYADLKGNLVKTGLIGMGRGDGDNIETRGYSYKDGFFIWMPTKLNSDGTISNNSNQKIGLCWTGMNNESPEFSAAPSLSQKVYTNYEFEHIGWLDVLAQAPDADVCSTDAMDNGAFIVGQGTPEAKTGSTKAATYGTAYQYDVSNNIPVGEYAQTSHPESSGDLHLGKGVFKTCNASIFEGEYLVYFPYTDQFTKGQILANVPESFSVNVDEDKFRTLSNHAFAVAHVDHYKGGNSMSSFRARTFSSIAGVKLYNYNIPGTAAADKKIKKVILYSKSGIIYEKDLNASKLVSALKNNSLGNGHDLYYTDNEKMTNSVYASLFDGGNSEYATITATVTKNNDEAASVYFPVLPQEINDLKIILIDEEDKTCEYAPDVKVFGPNSNSVTEINLNGLQFTNTYMVVDEETFVSAFKEIEANGAALPATNNIKLLKDITLENCDGLTYASWRYMGTMQSLFFSKNIKISSEFNAKLTLASGQKLHLKSLSSNAKLTVDVDVVVEGAGCCGDKVAKLSVGGTQSNICNLEFTKNVYNHGTLALGNVEGIAANISIDNLINTYDEAAVSKDKLKDAATLYFLGNTASDITIGTLENKGIIDAFAGSVEILAGADVIKNALPAPAINRPVNVSITNLTNEAVPARASSSIPFEGGHLTIGERTLITVSGDLNNKNEGVLVKVIGTSASETDGRLDVKGTSSNEGTIDNTGVINFTASSLTNTGLFIDRMSGQVGGMNVNNGTFAGTITKHYQGDPDDYYKTDLGVAGIYVSQVETVDRMRFVLSDLVVYPSTVIVEILSCDAAFYNLANFTRDLSEKDVYVKSPKTITFKAYQDTPSVELVDKSFGHCVTVFNGTVLQAKDGILSTVEDITISKGGTFRSLASTSGYPKTIVTIGGNLNNSGTTTHTASELNVGKNLYNKENTFTSSATFNVTGGIIISGGTFESKGTNNTAGYYNQTGTSVATFAHNTSTIISGKFECIGAPAKFDRLGLNGGATQRATVNVKQLGTLTGTTVTAWPTVY